MLPSKISNLAIKRCIITLHKFGGMMLTSLLMQMNENWLHIFFEKVLSVERESLERRLEKIEKIE